VANPAIATHAMNPGVSEKRFFTLFIIVTARSASSRIAGFSLGSCRAFCYRIAAKMSRLPTLRPLSGKERFFLFKSAILNFLYGRKAAQCLDENQCARSIVSPA
jgi:hypothetical protein